MKKVLCIALTLALILGCGAVCVTGSAVSLLEVIDAPDEEKVYCTATLDDDFADDCVIIVLTNPVSLEFKTYTPADFPERTQF